MIVDMHSHLITDDYITYLGKHNALLEDTMPLPHWNEDDTLQFMKEANIDVQMISLSSPHPYYDKEGYHICRSINEQACNIKQEHPGKFLYHAVVPLPDIEASIEEVKYCYDVLHVDGIKLPSNAHGLYLGDAKLEPLMKVLNDYHATINIHPHRPVPLANTYSSEAIPLFEFFCDTTRAVLNLAGKQVFERYPDITWIIPHCGAFLPMIVDRSTGLLPLMKHLGVLDYAANLKDIMSKLYFDIAGNPVPDCLPMLLKYVDPSHIFYGSDYPFTPAKMCSKNLETLLEYLEDKEYKDDILYKNALRVYKKEF